MCLLLHLFLGMLLNDAGIVAKGGQYVLRVIICLAISVLIEEVKKSINYNGLVSNIRNKTCGLGTQMKSRKEAIDE